MTTSQLKTKKNPYSFFLSHQSTVTKSINDCINSLLPLSRITCTQTKFYITVFMVWTWQIPFSTIRFVLTFWTFLCIYIMFQNVVAIFVQRSQKSRKTRVNIDLSLFWPNIHHHFSGANVSEYVAKTEKCPSWQNVWCLSTKTENFTSK